MRLFKFLNLFHFQNKDNFEFKKRKSSLNRITKNKNRVCFNLCYFTKERRKLKTKQNKNLQKKKFDFSDVIRFLTGFNEHYLNPLYKILKYINDVIFQNSMHSKVLKDSTKIFSNAFFNINYILFCIYYTFIKY